MIIYPLNLQTTTGPVPHIVFNTTCSVKLGVVSLIPLPIKQRQKSRPRFQSTTNKSLKHPYTSTITSFHSFILLLLSISIYILFRSLSSKHNVHVAIPQWFYSHIVLAINELNDLVQKKNKDQSTSIIKTWCAQIMQLFL
jgi:hypothetical protein